jgi:hypothetical protein
MLSFPVAWFDFDHDGWLDLLIAGFGKDGAASIASFYTGILHPDRKLTEIWGEGDISMRKFPRIL